MRDAIRRRPLGVGKGFIRTFDCTKQIYSLPEALISPTRDGAPLVYLTSGLPAVADLDCPVAGSAYGHSAPVSIHAWTNSPSNACEPGAGSRPAPGCQPHATRSSCARCSCKSERLRPPLRSGSLIWRQMSLTDLPSHAISIGAVIQRGWPGMLRYDACSCSVKFRSV